ncbi:hypothetical protein PENTCL1PPCAC_25970, partial [Pristionchus entomophagus]
MTRTGSLLTIILLSLLALVAQSYILPYEAYNEDGYYYMPSVAKRSSDMRHPAKREFNVDDLTLRFGKRSSMSSFGADDLALRFGRRR